MTIQKEHSTSNYYKEDHFTMAYKRLLTASHWIDPEGNQTKLSHNIKAIYNYRLDQYRSFSRDGKKYCESIKTVAKVLALSEDVSKETQALLIRMGLLHVDQPGTRTAYYTVYELKYLKGHLVNEKLSELPCNKSKKRKKGKTSGISWEEIQAIEHNKKQWDSKVKGIKEKVYILTKSEMDSLRGKRE